MESVFATIFTAVLTFAATNIDDIFVLMLFFSQPPEAIRSWQVVAGQYVGFCALVLISLLGFLGGLVIPSEWIGLLGLLPIALGVRQWLKRNEAEAEESDTSIKTGGAAAVGSVAAVTFANGGDNIGIYTPLFASLNGDGLAITLFVFFLLLGVWCYLGAIIARHPLVVGWLERYARYLVPLVLIGLGVYIIIESGTINLLRGR